MEIFPIFFWGGGFHRRVVGCYKGLKGKSHKNFTKRKCPQNRSKINIKRDICIRKVFGEGGILEMVFFLVPRPK